MDLTLSDLDQIKAFHIEKFLSYLTSYKFDNKILNNDEKAKARKSYKIEKQIIREAKKTYGSSPQISGYGQTKPSETIAEAVADVYTNKSKANPYSRVIVDIMKKKLKGK